MQIWDCRETFYRIRDLNGFALRVVTKIIDMGFFYYKLANCQKYLVKQIKAGAGEF